MDSSLNNYHVLVTKSGPVCFHGPSAKFFKINDSIAGILNALEKGEISEKFIPTSTRNEIEKIFKNLTSEGLASRSNLLGESNGLTGFYLFVSQECNLACSYCYGDGGEYRKNKMFMDESTAINFIDKFITKENSGYLINFFGGEPLLNFNLMKTIVAECKAKAKKHGFRIVFNMTTNGTVWNDKIAKFVAEEIGTVTISLDGPQNINDAQRVPRGNFSPYEKTVQAIGEMQQRGCNYTIRTIMSKNSQGKLSEIYHHNSKLAGKGGVGLSTVDVDINHPLALSEDEDRALVNEIVEINSESLRTLYEGYDPKFNEYTAELCKLIFGKKYRPRPCNAGQTVLAVAADGELYPCHRFVGYDQFCVGNVNDNPPLKCELRAK